MTGRPRTATDRHVLAYVGVLSLVAAVAATQAASVSVAVAPSRPVLAAFAALIALAEVFSVRYRHRGGIDALNVAEGLIAPLVLVASGVQVVVVVAASLLVTQLVGRNQPVKALFNLVQWVLGASLAILALDAVRSATSTGVGLDVAQLAVVVLVLSLTNQAAMLGVMRVVGAGSRDSTDRLSREIVAHHAIGAAAGYVTALCVTAAYRWDPWMILVGAAIVAGVHRTGSANAALRTDRKRLDAQQSATHHLTASVDAAAALPSFLEEVQRGFEVQRVELVLLGGGRPSVHSCTPDSGYAVTQGPHPLAELLAQSLTAPSRLESASPAVAEALAARGHRRALAAPLRSGATTTGMLLLFDRAGIDSFEAGELTIAGSLARELVGFLERVELVRAIDEERRASTDIVEHTSDGIITLATDGTVLSWNAGMVAITGYTAEEMVGTRHMALLRPRTADGVDIHILGWRERLADPGLSPDLQVVTAAGATVWLSCSYSCVPRGEPDGDVLVIVARNITKARELELLKDDFVAVVSHELRTPLVPIRGWAQTLLNRGDRLTEAQRRTAVQSILAQAQRLESLILNILEASRVEAGVAEAVDTVDVAPVVAGVVEDTRVARADRPLRLTLPDAACRVRGSTVWVERVVSNLVANAVKYSPEGSPVDVAVTAYDETVEVTVTDRGAGIPAADRELVFERFSRLPQTAQQTGTGLGLYITRRLARSMGGDVVVAASSPAGSTFRLTLPRLPAAVTAVPDGLPRQSATGGGARSA